MPLAVRGYREFMVATRHADREQRKAIREELRQAGESVRGDAQTNFSPINSRSASGYRTRVRQRGIVVEQSIRRTTGNHPEYGSLQMRRALLPAMAANESELMRDLELAMDRIADRFERTP